MFKRIFLFLILFSSSIHLQDTNSWVIDDIRLTGLQRVSAGSVFAVMPVGLGDEINKEIFKELSGRGNNKQPKLWKEIRQIIFSFISKFKITME